MGSKTACGLALSSLSSLKSITAVKALAALAAAAVLGLAAGPARAGFTPVKTPGHKTEANQKAILDNLYGGSFAADGENFTNGVVTARRSFDFKPPAGGASLKTTGLSEGPAAAADDRAWTGGVVSARVVARYAGYEQSFGIVDGSGQYHNFFDVSGNGTAVTGGVTGVDLTGQTWTWARRGGGDPHSSDSAQNADAADHMVSYRVTEPAADGTAKWLLFWEDGPADDSDFDYNDLVVEVTAVAPLGGVAVIPLPPAVWTGLTMLLGGGLWTARHRIRKWFA